MTTPAGHTISLRYGLELRLAPTAAPNGVVTGIDMRLFRRLDCPLGGDVFGATAAGIRLPRAALRDVASALLAVAGELESRGP